MFNWFWQPTSASLCGAFILYINRSAHMHICSHICNYAYINEYMLMHICYRKCIYARIYTYMRASTDICAHACCVCAHKHLCTHCTHICGMMPPQFDRAPLAIISTPGGKQRARTVDSPTGVLKKTKDYVFKTGCSNVFSAGVRGGMELNTS